MKGNKKTLILFLSGISALLFTLISLVIYLIVKINAITSMGAIGIIGGAGAPTLTLFVRMFFGECFGLFLLLPIVGVALVIVAAAVMRFKKSK